MNVPMMVKAPTADINIQSMLRVGAAKPLLMFPKPESGRRANMVLLISHAPMIRRRLDTTGLATTVETQQQNSQCLTDQLGLPLQLLFSQRVP